MKFIRLAAVKYNQELYVGYSHSECYSIIFELHKAKRADLPKSCEGFATSEGVFVDREEALKIAREANQVCDTVAPALESWMITAWEPQ